MVKEKVQNRNKLKIAIIAMIATILIAVGAMIGVFAATNQTVTSTFNVTYSVGNNVAARVRTEKYVPNLDSDGDGTADGVTTITKDKDNNEVDGLENGYVVFNAVDPETSTEVYIGDVTLNPLASKAYFYFTVQSMLGEGFVRVLCNPIYTIKNNMTVKISYCNIDDGEDFESTTSASEIAEENWIQAFYNNIPSNGYKMIRVELSVSNINRAASCGGDINLTLEYSNGDGSLTALETSEAYTALTTNTTATEIKFLYAEEEPISVVKASSDETTSEPEKKIWTELVDTTLYVYSNYTIDMPADCKSLFEGRTALTSLDLTNFNTSNVTTMERMFRSCSSLISLNVSRFDTSKVTNMLGTFGYCSSLTELDLSSFDTSNVTDMSYMFYKDSNLKKIQLSNFDIAEVKTLRSMFYECRVLDGVDVSNFNTAQVTDFSFMFAFCNSLTSVDVSNFNTENATNMKAMFGECFVLKNLDVSGFDTSNVVNIEQMFFKCCELTSLDVSGFDTSKVTSLFSMFEGGYKLKFLDVSNFDTTNVTDLSYMFNQCHSIEKLDVSKWDTTNVTDMSNMFNGCYELTTIYASDKFVVSDGTTTSYMFTGSTKLVGAISYSSSKVDGSYANYTTGYFTYKESKVGHES